MASELDIERTTKDPPASPVIQTSIVPSELATNVQTDINRALPVVAKCSRAPSSSARLAPTAASG